jgi:hypothetical protein
MNTEKEINMTSTYVSWDASEAMRHTNERFDQLITTLLKDEIITEEQAVEISSYRSVIAEKNVFGKLWDGVFKNAKEGSWVMTIEKFKQ